MKKLFTIIMIISTSFFSCFSMESNKLEKTSFLKKIEKNLIHISFISDNIIFNKIYFPLKNTFFGYCEGMVIIKNLKTNEPSIKFYTRNQICPYQDIQNDSIKKIIIIWEEFDKNEDRKVESIDYTDETETFSQEINKIKLKLNKLYKEKYINFLEID